MTMGAQASSLEGGRGVRDRIVRGARHLLEERGVEQAVTLRAVAREAGVSAPSIYHHFPDLRAVLEAVIDEAYTEYAAATYDVAAAVEDPLERIRVGALASLRFAWKSPATFRILFARHRPSELPTVAGRAAAHHELTVTAIDACAPGRRPAHANARTDAMLLWLGLHGASELRPAHPRFPWPPEEEIVDGLLRRIVLRDPSA